MLLSQPKAYFLLHLLGRLRGTAGESVFCSSTSAPLLISEVAASAPCGSDRTNLLTHTTLVLIFGLTPAHRG